MATQNVAGPLCFGGDMIGRGVVLPRMARGDFVVVHDSGSNTMSMFSRHCSRPAPAVYGYRVKEETAENAGNEPVADEDDDVLLTVLKTAETPEDVMRFWG